MHGDGNQCLGQGKKLLVPTLQQGHTCMTPLVQATAGEAATSWLHSHVEGQSQRASNGAI